MIPAEREGRAHLEDDDYSRLLEFRTGLRTFLKWSKDRAAQAGLTPSQHQLLLAIRGHRGAPTIGDVAHYLLIKPHTGAELVARAEAAGLVRRAADEKDGRVVRLTLTSLGSRKLEAITASTLEELDRLGPTLRAYGRAWRSRSVPSVRWTVHPDGQALPRPRKGATG